MGQEATNKIIADNQKLLDEQAKNLLKVQIRNHNSGHCKCDEVCGNCYAAMWMAGLISSQQVIEDLYYPKETPK